MRSLLGSVDSLIKLLNRLIIYFFIPLLTLKHIPAIDFHINYLWLSLTPFIIFGFSRLFFELISRYTSSIDADMKIALSLTSGISSTSFVGFPIFELLYGDEGLSLGILLSLGGTILVFNTLGITSLFYHLNKKKSIVRTLNRLFSFIPFVMFIIAVTLNIFNIRFPDSFVTVLDILTTPFTIVALFTVGIQIQLNAIRDQWSNLLLGQFFKLLLAPLLIYFVLLCFANPNTLVAKICILGAGIGSMNAMSILCAEKGLKPKFSILMPAISIPLSIPTVLLIDRLLS